MNAGKDYKRAKAQAQANADRSQSPRWLHQYGGSWWISTTPTADAEQLDPALRHATKKSPAQLDREIAESLASTAKWRPVDLGFEAGFKAGEEQALHEDTPRETLRQLRESARTEFDRGLVAGYERVCRGTTDGFRSPTKGGAGPGHSHATIKADSPWVTARKSSGATIIERQAHDCNLTVVPVDWSSPRGPANWSVTCRDPRATDLGHQRGQAPSMGAAKQAAMRAARGMAVRQTKASSTKRPSSRGAASRQLAHSTMKSRSDDIVAQMIGRHVKSGWHGLADGEIIQWDPFGAGMTDVLVRNDASGHQSWYASHGLTPIDGRGPLPSRAEVRKLREAEVEASMRKIGERWAKEPPPPRIRR